MFRNRAEKRTNKLHDTFISLETSLKTLNKTLTSLRTLIDSRVPPLHNHIAAAPAIPPISECDDTNALKYVKATLEETHSRLKAIDAQIDQAVVKVERLRKKLAYKMEKGDLDDDNEWPGGRIDGWIYEMQLLRRCRLVKWEREGDEWGYFDEWLEEIQELHGVAWGLFRGMSELGSTFTTAGNV